MVTITVKYRVKNAYFRKKFTADIYEEANHLYELWRDGIEGIEVVEFEVNE